jgi:phosphohistidine phosphatase
MDLILWRHAEAEDGHDALPDAKRRLTDRGEKQARKTARWLHNYLPKSTRILVSPAQRTQQTAYALHWPFEIEPNVSVGRTAIELITAAGWPEAARTTLIIGHQPTLGQVAALLLSGHEQAWAIKKGAVWWFTSREREGERQTVLRTVLNPDFL